MKRRAENNLMSEEEAIALFMKELGWTRERTIDFLEASVRAGGIKPLDEKSGRELTEEERAVWKVWATLN